MKIKSLHHALAEGLQICKDYKNFCTQQERETEQAKRQGYVLTAEKRQEMDSAREFNRKSALKQLNLLRESYREYLESDSQLLPFGYVDRSETPVGFSTSEIRFLQSMQYIKLSPEQFQAYIKHYAADNSNPAMVTALKQMAEKEGYKVTGIDSRTVPERMTAFDNVIKKLGMQLREPEFYEDGFNQVSADMMLEEVEALKEKEYAGNRSKLIDEISVKDPATEKLDVFGVSVEPEPEGEKITPQDERNILTGLLGKETVEEQDRVEATAHAEMARRSNAELEAERAKAEAEERALVRAKIQADVNAELEAKAQAEAQAQAEAKAEIQRQHREERRERVLPEWALNKQ